MKRMLLSVVLALSLLGCRTHSVRTVVKRPAPCQVSVYPPIPSNVEMSVCSIEGVEYICFKPEEITKIALWSEQVERWKLEVQKCPYVKEFTYENGMYNIMKSFPN